MFSFFALVFIALLIVFTYLSLPNTFFQQDEWQTFASNIYYINKGIKGVIESFLPTDPLSHFNPLARVFSWFEYMFYKTNFTLYAWQSIILHILNASLLYYFVRTWLKTKQSLLSRKLESKKIAFIAALFFGVNSIPHQAVTWIAAANSYEIPTLFILASLIFFQKFLDQKDNRKRNVIISLLALFMSFLFHENGIFLLFFYPILFSLYRNKEKKKLLRTLSFGLLLLIVIFFLVRLPFFFGLLNPLQSVTDISRPPIAVYPYRAVSIGLKSFAGSLFPEKTLIAISEEIVRLGYPQFITPDRIPNPFISQSIVFDLMSYALTFLIVCFIVFIILLTREKNILQGLIWSLIFIPTSLLPYGFVLGKAGYASILDPKFFYVAGIGVSILVAFVMGTLAQKFSKAKPLVATIYILYGLYVLFHVYSVKTHVDKLQTISVQRKSLLTTITSSYKTLPQNVVFYTKSDTAYYGMPDNEKILPVQVGFGKMLMIWYQKEEKFPVCLYEENFLMDLLEEGYRSCGGRGFGYFRDYDKLVDAVKANDISPKSIISYSWNGNTNEFTDMTNKIRSKLKADIGRGLHNEEVLKE